MTEFSDETRAEAAAWIARLHGPQRTAGTEEGFRRWLVSDPRNAKVFEGMTEIWDAVGNSQSGRFPRVNAWHGSRRRGNYTRFAAAAAIAVFVCGVAGYAAYALLRDPVYATEIGKQRTVELSDGSHVMLNSNTRLTVQFDGSARHIRLDRGEAFFDVAAERGRPFSVIVGDHEVTALGTSFIVRHDTERTAVTLVTGKVAVSSLSPPPRAGEGEGGGIRYLTPGERLTITAKRREHIDTPAVETLAAWRHGEVVLDHTPLAEAAAEMNRYDSTEIIVEDADVASLRISGNYKTGDAEGFARAVANMYGFEVERRDGKIHLRAPGR